MTPIYLHTITTATYWQRRTRCTALQNTSITTGAGSKKS